MSNDGVWVTKSDMATDRLREMISEGTLPPGESLRPRDLAQLFSVSATPVREALRRLESEGLVNFDPHRGAAVATLDFEKLEENYRILAALESLAGTLAVQKITNDELDEIEALHTEVAACDPLDERLKELNRRFHFRIYECARSPMLLLLMRLLWRSFPGGPQTGRPREESIEQHERLIVAMKRRDADAAAVVIREHVLGSIDHMRRFVQASPSRTATP